jgi:hypothetical protein
MPEQTDAASVSVDDNPFRFWGGSEIINPFGQAIITAALFDPDAIFAEISRDIVRKKRILLPYLRNDDPLLHPPGTGPDPVRQTPCGIKTTAHTRFDRCETTSGLP